MVGQAVVRFRRKSFRNMREPAKGHCQFKLSYGIRRNKIKLLGNGVCAPVMKAIAGCFQGGMTEDPLMAAECCE